MLASGLRPLRHFCYVINMAHSQFLDRNCIAISNTFSHNIHVIKYLVHKYAIWDTCIQKSCLLLKRKGELLSFNLNKNDNTVAQTLSLSDSLHLQQDSSCSCLSAAQTSRNRFGTFFMAQKNEYFMRKWS